MSETLKIDDLTIEIRRSPRRRTVDLVVDRFGDLVINVPEALNEAQVIGIVRRKQEWIYTKLQQKESILKPGNAKEYVTGEGFYYLGKKYRLKLVADKADAPLRLLNGRFVMSRQAAKQGRDHFISWYTRRGKEWIRGAVELLRERVAVTPRSVVVRDLGYRWASCNTQKTVYFHWRVTLMPPNIIRYLVLHELVHLHEPNHSPAFYRRLARACPEHKTLEHWLEVNGDRFDI